MKFININGRILDYDKYREEVDVMTKVINSDIKEVMSKYGFKSKPYGFYNEDLDLMVQVNVKKKCKEAFV